MKTIKTKLFLIFMTLMVSLILSGILLNSIFLGSYYMYKNKVMLISVSEEISDEYIADKEKGYDYINMIDSIDGVSTTIVDQNLNVKYLSSSENLNNDNKNLSKEIKQIISENEKKISKKYVYTVFEKNNKQRPKLIFASKMSNGEFIVLQKPIKSIRENVSIANQFYIIASGIVIFIGGIFILIFSKKITEPIIEMSKVAQNISNLDFNKRVKIKSQDELGTLGKSINKISEKLSSSIDELKADVERRKQLVRNMSHELKTPIGIIKGYAEGLKYGVVDDKEKMQKYCSVLVDECDRMDKLVLELLNHSMMEAGMVEVNITSFELEDFLSTIVDRFKPTFMDKDITFGLKCINNQIISADRDMLEKAVNNFITNAIDHVEGRNFIQLTCEKKENGIKISVFNTGSHIPMRDIEKIWDVYYKVDKARSRKYGGHGLGLAIVKLIAQLHNGTINVENVDEGVIFSIELP